MRPVPHYEDLAIKIEAAPAKRGFRICLLLSPFGCSPPVRFVPPFPDRNAPEILRSLEASILRSGRLPLGPGGGVRDLAPVETDRRVSPGEVGQALFESLFVGPIRENLLASLALIEGTENTGLRLRLVLDPVAAERVGRWPWELLYRSETRDFLGRSIRTPIVRQLEVQRPSLTPTPISRVRILVLLSNPGDLSPLEVSREKELIQSALGSAPEVDLRFVEHPTIEELRRQVREGFDILHFVGHGDLDPSGQGVLMFEGVEGQANAVAAAVLADTLKGFHRVRLVFLNGCRTARLPRPADGQDPFLGAASALVMAGIPAVVAMQFPISDPAALVFSSAFYRNLAAGDPLEAAVADGRMAVLQAQPSSWEWATPALLLGVPHGRLFAIGSQEQKPAKVRPVKAGAATTPLNCLSKLDAIDPAKKPELLAYRESQARELPGQAHVHYALGLSHLDLGRYDQAEASLKRALDLGSREPGLGFYIALASLGGRQLRGLTLPRVREIESYLEAALHTDGDSPEVLVLSAIIKYDYHRAKRFRVEPPSVEDLLVAARRCPTPPGDVHLLTRHVTVPASLRNLLPPVRA